MDLSPGIMTVPDRRFTRVIVFIAVEFTTLILNLLFNSQQDFAAGLTSLHAAVGLGGLLERKLQADAQMDFAIGNPFEDAHDSTLGDFRRAAHGEEPESADLQRPRVKAGHVNGVRPAARRAKADQMTERRKRSQAALDRFLAYRIEHQVHSAVMGQLGNPLREIDLSIEN